METPDLDPIEREALSFIIRELEAGRTHVFTDTFYPFLESVGAGDRLVAILTYLEGLGILTGERPSGSRWGGSPLVGRTIPAYWRIEGKAVILYRSLADKRPGENKRANDRKQRRGRPVDTDTKRDEQIWDAWHTGEHKNYADLARHLGTNESHVARAIDRHRQRLARSSAARRTNSPDT
jgi:hypothetical protein